MTGEITSLQTFSGRMSEDAHVPLTPDQELTEHELRVELIKSQRKRADEQFGWEPWKAMAVAAGAGAAIMGALIGISTAILTLILKH